MVEVRKAISASVDVQVELFGRARILACRRQVDMAVPSPAQPEDLAASLGETCPELIGAVIREDRSGLQESYTFNLNGTAFVDGGPLDLRPGDHLLLFSSQAGG